MATGDKLVNLDVLKNTVQKEVVDLKSAFTETDFDIASYTGKIVITDTHKNKYIKNTDGTLANYNNWVASDFIKCEPGMALNIPSRVGNYNAYYTEKNEASFLSALNAGNNIVPANAKYFRVSSTKAVYDEYGFGVTTNRTGFDDIAMTATNDPINSANKWAAFSNDANNLGVNKIYEIMYNTNVSGLPASDFLGTIITFDYSVTSAAPTIVQMAFARYGHTYRRIKWGNNWGEWYEFASTSDVPYASTAYKALGNFLAVGDSWTVSLAYPTAGEGQNGITVKSWAEHFAEMSGSECIIIARGGRTTKAFIDTGVSGDYGEAVADTSDYAILYLGINDITAITATSPTETIEQFTTYYTQIVNDLLTNHNFVFCLNIPKAGHTSSGRGAVNAAIASVCESINNAYLVDLTNVPDTITPLSANGHLSSVGYTAFAEMVAEGISKAMASNSYFATGIDQ